VGVSLPAAAGVVVSFMPSVATAAAAAVDVVTVRKGAIGFGVSVCC
jgi:hypothetical protein